jgi:hypothetical protein
MKNREIFVRDPVTEQIPNNGVATVAEATSDVEVKTLRYELQNFVSEGQYDAGLRRILSSFLSSLGGAAEQKGIWVSGFYGSGKSHLVKVLRFLWTDYEFSDGATARELVKGISSDVRELLRELETVAKRHGGVHAAAGTLGSQTANDIPLAVLQILLRSLGMPDQYPAARLYLRLHEEGSLANVRAHVEGQGKSLLTELKNMYISAPLREALVKHSPGFGVEPNQVPALLKAQFPPSVERISVEQMVETMHSALNHSGPMPLTLLVFDELQQFIGDSADRSYDVQEIVEACSKRFQSKLLFVATGQSAITATKNLQRLTDRFPVQISLSDTDVETVTRTIVLNKKPSEKAKVQELLDRNSGEVFRHLQGSTIAPKSADGDILVADYPILPSRRRFWERVLRAVDPTGTSSMLRAQLRIVDEAVRGVAEKELGNVVPADILFDQMKDSLQQTGALMFEERDTIERQVKNDSPGKPGSGKLKTRLCALIYLIGKLPKDGAGDIGVRATPEMLADLLVENLQDGGAELRRLVPEALKELSESSDLMLVNGEYRIQTREGSEWAGDFEARRRKISADKSRTAEVRSKHVQNGLDSELKAVSILQGQTKEKRKVTPHTGQDRPPIDGGQIPLWVRDGWTVTEKVVRDDASRAGLEDATVYVFIPAATDELNSAIANFEAASETLAAKGIPNTEEGRQARASIEQRKAGFEQEIKRLVSEALESSLVLLGGGSEVDEPQTLRAKLQSACDSAAKRMFPKFGNADDPKWHLVIQRARTGSLDPLEAIGFKGAATEHPVCKAVLEHLGPGKRGSEVRNRFTREPYGWPQDAIDGALLALLAGGAVLGIRQTKPVKATDLDQKTIGDAEFRVEKFQLTATQRIELRKLFQTLEVPCKTGEETGAGPLFIQKAMDLASAAGGEPPVPERPNLSDLQVINELSGNEQLLALYKRREELVKLFDEWKRLKKLIEDRRPGWERLKELLGLAVKLETYEAFKEQAEAIRTGRQLLHDPDPVKPLVEAVSTELREALQSVSGRYLELHKAELDALETSDAWEKLEHEQWKAILQDAKIRIVSPPNVGKTSELVDSLRSKGLDVWDAELDALPARFGQAERMASKRLEPTSVSYPIPRRLLRTNEDVEAYVEEVRKALLAKVAENPVQVS